MEQKYYAVPEAPLFLTLSDKPGTLQYVEVLWNIMRMLLMSEEGLDAEESLKMLNEMPKEAFDSLKARAAAEYSDPQFQEYLERKHLYLGTPNAPQLQPVEQILSGEGETLREKEVIELMWEMLDEMDWSGFQMWELDNSCEMD